jgi:hypothetical protein
VSESTPGHVGRKPCSNCGRVKPLTLFPVQGRGRAAACTACRNALPPPTHMTCTGGCGKTKPVSEFCRMGDGYKKPCKECHRQKCRKPDSSPRKQFPAPPPDYKWCTQCEECKSVAAFPRKAVGCGSWCKVCVAVHNRERYKLPDVRADRRARRDRWGEDNPGWATQWAANNPERAREKYRRAAAIRRARLNGLSTEPYTMAELIERDGPCCVLCGGELKLGARHPHSLAPTVEHLECLSWPESAGDIPSNCAVAHFSCNSKRGDRPHPAAARKRAELLAAAAQLG